MSKSSMESNHEVIADRTGTRTQSLNEGESVVLNGGDQRILVKRVKAFERGQFKGVIHGFSPSFAQQYQGLKVGDDIWFDAADIAK
jgi:hypothetical protein